MKKLLLFALLLSVSASAQTGNIPVLGNIPVVGNGAGFSFAVDSFTGAYTTLLSAHTSDSGHSWTQWASGPDATRIVELTGSGSVVGVTVGLNASYYNSAVPSSPNYTVSVSCKVGASGVSAMVCGPVAALSTAVYTAYMSLNTGGTCQLYQVVAATVTQLGSNASISCSWAVGSTHTLAVQRTGTNGTTVTLLVDGVADSNAKGTGTITAVGRAGIRIDGGGLRGNLGSFRVY